MNAIINTMTHNINVLGFFRKVFLLIVPFLLVSTEGLGQLAADFYASNVIVCSGSSVSFTDNSSGVTGSTTYLWNFGEMASPATATGAGPHTVIYTGSGKRTVSLTLTDEVSVTKRETDYITVNALPPAPVVSVSDDCDGTSTLTASGSGFLLWNTMAMSSAIKVTEPGLYTVTTTVNGCTSLPGSGMASPKTSPAPPVVSIDCSEGEGEAVITIISPRGEGYQYRLNGGSYRSTPSFNDVDNGSHTITVRNASGCTTTGDYFEVSCECSNGATVTLSSTSGSTCGLTPVTISGNTFGGGATRVTITENGSGSVSPAISFSSPFTFTYTPRAGDIGRTVIITVTTNEPDDDDCEESSEVYRLTVNAFPEAPTFGIIVQPTCSEQTANAEIKGLPTTGTWTLTQSPGGIVSGNGSGTTITNLMPGTYTYTVTSEAGCVSETSGDLIITPQPPDPDPPSVNNITQPTCNTPTGSVELNGLPASGSWTLIRSPGAVRVTGSGTSRVITGLPAGTYTFTVANSLGCTSLSSSSVVIETQPDSPATPIIGTTVHPTCTTPTGSVEVSGLPASGAWTLTRNPGGVNVTGSGTSRVISGLTAGTYTFSVTNSEGCTSLASAGVVINSQPEGPGIPLTGTIVQPTCTTPTGSVVLNGLPAPGTWTLTRNPGAVLVSGSGTSITISGLPAGAYTFSVTNSAGCTSLSSSGVVITAQPVTPAAPNVGTRVHPTCTTPTGSVELNGLPASGSWTLTRNPGAVRVTGSGTSRVISGLPAGTYTYTVTNSAGCTSLASAGVVINAQPESPARPTIGTIVQPGCTTPTGSIEVSGLPSSGTWMLTRNPGGVNVTGSGTSRVISGLSAGTYTFSVTNSAGCTSLVSSGVVISSQPQTPSAPIVGTIILPSCSMPTGSVEIRGLPASGLWTLTRNPGAIKVTGTGTSKVIAGLPTGTYTFTVSNVAGCNSGLSSLVTIPLQPGMPDLKITNPAPLCAPASFDLTDKSITTGSTAGLTLTYWRDATATQSYVTPANAAEGTYYIRGTTPAGCSDIKPVTAKTVKKSNADAGPDQEIEFEFATTLDALPPTDLETGIWSIISGTGQFADFANAKTTVNGLSPGTNVFLWTVSTGVCPDSYDTVNVVVIDFEIKTLLTPNMDGRNDYFILRGLPTLGRTEVTIFNRQGVKVYENRDYDNSWNGVDLNEKPLPEDTYFYILRSESGRTEKGYVVIRR